MNYKYLWFCTSCGLPSEVTKHIMHHYFSNHSANIIYCNHCQSENKIPNYLKKVAKELK